MAILNRNYKQNGNKRKIFQYDKGYNLKPMENIILNSETLNLFPWNRESDSFFYNCKVTLFYMLKYSKYNKGKWNYRYKYREKQNQLVFHQNISFK